MPIYEYKCKKCGEKFDVYRTFFEVKKIKCPKCGGEEAEQVFSPFFGKSDSCQTTTFHGG